MARRAARAYVAGECLDDALAVSGRLSERGVSATLGFSDAVGDPPESVYAADCAAIDGLGREKRETYLSIKFPSLGFSGDLLEQLMIRAQGAGVRLHFDSLAPNTVDRTWMRHSDRNKGTQLFFERRSNCGRRTSEKELRPLLFGLHAAGSLAAQR